MALNLWDPTELEAYLLSRKGFHTGPCHATFHHGQRGRLPPVRPPWKGVGRPLPHTAPLLHSLAETLRERRSVRSRGALTMEQVSALLWHSVRIKEVVEGEAYDSIRKPVPSGGGMHLLEVYPVIEGIEGWEPGLYHYRADQHTLTHIHRMDTTCRALLTDVAASMGVDETPPCLLICAARWGRTLWKYQGMGYAAVLKDVGVLYGTWSLLATALDAGPCPLGGGDADLFGRLTGLDPLEEGSVGEFVLWGGPPPRNQTSPARVETSRPGSPTGG